jgi:hypothetical protein
MLNLIDNTLVPTALSFLINLYLVSSLNLTCASVITFTDLSRRAWISLSSVFLLNINLILHASQPVEFYLPFVVSSKLKSASFRVHTQEVVAFSSNNAKILQNIRWQLETLESVQKSDESFIILRGIARIPG